MRSIFFPNVSTNWGRMLSGLVFPLTAGNVCFHSQLETSSWDQKRNWYPRASWNGFKFSYIDSLCIQWSWLKWGLHLKDMIPEVLPTTGASEGAAAPAPSVLPLAPVVWARRAALSSPISGRSVWKRVPFSSWRDFIDLIFNIYSLDQVSKAVWWACKSTSVKIWWTKKIPHLNLKIAFTSCLFLIFLLRFKSFTKNHVDFLLAVNGVHPQVFWGFCPSNSFRNHGPQLVPE